MLKFINKAVEKIFGNKSEKDIKSIMPLVEKTNEIYSGLSSISNDELRNKTKEFRQRISEYVKETDDEIDALLKSVSDNPDMDVDEKEAIYEQVDKLKETRDKQLEEVLMEILPDAFAVVKETARRFKENDKLESTATELDKELSTLGDHIQINGDSVTYYNKWLAAGTEITWDMLHYDVQLVGGIVLHQGKIAEMATGEGKTLVATLPAYLNGLTGLGVHIVTVNDYLARRDSEWMAPIFNFLGLTCDCIDKYQPHSDGRKKAYKSDVAYGTNNEFGFDYLRDNMSGQTEELVQQKLHFAMVDEVDSVLVDDARTPLIISGPVPKGDQHEFHELKPRIERLVNVQKKAVTQFLTDAKRLIKEGKTGPEEGEGGLALLRANRAMPKHKPLIKFLSEQGNKLIMQKTENHYLQDQAKNMPKVDQELYFVIDEKNNSVELTEKGIELITGSGEDPNFFIMPDVGGEIATIEKAELSSEEKIERKDKLMQDFAVKSERIHSISQLLKAYTLFEHDVEYVVMDGKVKIVDENTGRIMEGRRYSDGLHQAIEAKENVKVEAATQTFATVTLQNFFRMYHKLAGMTGTAETEAGEFWEIYELDVVVIPTNKPIVRDDKDDMVYKTNREKFNAIISHTEELVKAGRPVLVGTTTVDISELLSRMLKMKGIKHKVLNAKQHQSEADIVAEAGRPGAVTIATNMAGRGTDIKIGKEVKEAGGLAIVGSERHESRRVDRQLRGRSGRQGDPGSSQFFVSLEDNLMRLFGSDRIAKLMDRMGYEEGEVIQHSMVSKSLERAQKKVEENNFGIRKRLLEYDDIMNAQREVVYKKRKHALFGERLSVDLNNMFFDLAEEVVANNHEVEDYENFKMDVIRNFSMETNIEEEEFLKGNINELTEKLYAQAQEFYKRKGEMLSKTAFPVLKNIYENRGEVIKRVVIPFTDGSKELNVPIVLDEVMENEGKNLMRAFEKSITLAIIDNAWKDHLRQMDELKQSVQSAVYEQKDPLLIYKLEAFNLFKALVARMNLEVSAFLFKGNIPVSDPDKVREARQQKTDMSKMKAGRDSNNALVGGNSNAGGNQPQQQEQKKPEPVRVGEKVGRNDPCPCGSGKKYKHCHGKA
ncbi:MAG: preprotein translocase subunit SecA [Chitinophagales bacterium]